MLPAFKIAAVLIAMMLVSCGSGESGVGNDNKGSDRDPGESLVKANRYLVKAEEEDIRNYIRRHNWQMEESGSGLRYWIYEQGEGPRAQKGMVAELEYRLWLINGELVYSSDQDGIKTFLIGRGGVESGLEEAILLMRLGDKARLIIPSHLAHGLLGDQKRIPPRTALVYELELINLK